jgi:hypothetical protein
MIYDQNNNSHHHHILIYRSTPAVVNRMRVDRWHQYLSQVKPKFHTTNQNKCKDEGRIVPVAGVGRCKGRRRSLSESDMMHPLPSLASPRQRSKSKSHALPARGSSLPPNIYRRWSGVEWSFKSQNIGSTFSTFPLTGFSTRAGD